MLRIGKVPSSPFAWRRPPPVLSDACYTTPADIEDGRNLAEPGTFCRKMGRDARQGEVGLVVGDEYFAIQEFAEA